MSVPGFLRRACAAAIGSVMGSLTISVVGSVFIALTFGPAAAQLTGIKVLALVAGRAVTDRQVALDSVLEQPKLFKASGGQPIKLSEEQLDKNLQRVLTQVMVGEEGKILGAESVKPKVLESELDMLHKELGANLWKKFLAVYELSEEDVRSRIREKLQIQEAINVRVRTATAGMSGQPAAKREEAARKALEDWLKQLKARYRIQLFRYNASS